MLRFDFMYISINQSNQINQSDEMILVELANQMMSVRSSFVRMAAEMAVLLREQGWCVG